MVAGVRITHPERVLFGREGITKAQLAAYYAGAGDLILPHIEGRPLSIVRCPNGADAPCFFQKHVMPGMNKSIKPVRVSPKKEDANYLSVGDVQGLVALVQFGAIELHPWGAKVKSLGKPDRVVIDLDPDPAVSWRDLAKAAAEARECLRRFGLTSFLKSTGGKGLHVVAPLIPKAPWAAIKTFAKTIAEEMAADNPLLYIAKAAKAARKGKIFIDYLRNDRGATAVAAYSVRARAGAPVALPLSWNALKRAVRPEPASVLTVHKTISAGDPWAGFFALRQILPVRSRTAKK